MTSLFADRLPARMIGPALQKATVSAWRVALEARGLGSISINVRITAVRKLAVEACPSRDWLSIRQAQTLLNAPDVSTKKGLRDRAMLAVLLGCGLRRSEVTAVCSV